MHTCDVGTSFTHIFIFSMSLLLVRLTSAFVYLLSVCMSFLPFCYNLSRISDSSHLLRLLVMKAGDVSIWK